MRQVRTYFVLLIGSGLEANAIRLRAAVIASCSLPGTRASSLFDPDRNKCTLGARSRETGTASASGGQTHLKDRAGTCHREILEIPPDLSGKCLPRTDCRGGLAPTYAREVGHIVSAHGALRNALKLALR